MLEETVARTESFTRLDRTFTVVGRNHAEIAGKLLSDTAVRNLVEPIGRNTAACIGLAALHIDRQSGNDPVVVLPADHFIADVENFAKTVRAAAEVARTGAIITIGIAPTRPETGYGYIETAGEKGESLGQPFFTVERFVEKPDYETALGYLSKGRYLWNSGIFIFTAQTILGEIKNCLPALHDGLMEISEAIGTSEYDTIVERIYKALPSISIDFGVMEKTTKPIFVFKANFDWSDVGSWQALYELRSSEYDDSENLLLGEAMAVDSKRNLIYSTEKRKIALLGVEGLVVVDTPDALMVADIKRSQDVKRFTEILKTR